MICEYLEGCREELPPTSFGRILTSGWARGLWWALLTAAILMFCGQTSKFIYIDF